MALAHFRMLIHELLNKDTYVVTKETPITILVIRSAICIAKSDKETNNTRHIDRRVNFVRNVEK